MQTTRQEDSMTKKERAWAASIQRAIAEKRILPEWVDGLPPRWKQIYDEHTAK